jgi:hypothetical protein
MDLPLVGIDGDRRLRFLLPKLGHRLLVPPGVGEEQG